MPRLKFQAGDKVVVNRKIPTWWRQYEGKYGYVKGYVGDGLYTVRFDDGLGKDMAREGQSFPFYARELDRVEESC